MLVSDTGVADLPIETLRYKLAATCSIDPSPDKAEPSELTVALVSVFIPLENAMLLSVKLALEWSMLTFLNKLSPTWENEPSSGVSVGSVTIARLRVVFTPRENDVLESDTGVADLPTETLRYKLF